MYFPEPVFDAYSGLNVPTAGCRQLERLPGAGGGAGPAPRRTRARASRPTTTPTGPRTPRATSAGSVVTTSSCGCSPAAVDKQGLGNPITDNDLLGAVAPQLQVDSGFSLGQMFGLVTTFHGINIEQDAPADPARDRPVEPELLLPGLRLRERGAHQPAQRPPGRHRASSGIGRRPRHHDGQAPARPGIGHGVGAQRDGPDGPGRPDRGRPQGPGIRDGGPGRRSGERLAVGDDRVLLVAEPPGRRPSRCCTRCRGRSPWARAPRPTAPTSRWSRAPTSR